MKPSIMVRRFPPTPRATPGWDWLGGSLSLGESDGLGWRADIHVCETAERLASCTVALYSTRVFLPRSCVCWVPLPWV